ncbi:MAG: hypothetical protein CMJ58_05870 [Planctomycetaceae bacterium]|nr:hypothetical protein [Planctomycetaceae bacterium]
MRSCSSAAGRLLCCGLFAATLAVGCRSPYYADRGTGVGALAGAGAGALIGDAVGGDAGAGALIGAGLGAVTGNVVGGAMDDMQAQNRAEIAAAMGRQVQAGAASIDEVIAMTRAGVDPQLIQGYVRTSGVNRPLTAQDVIYLHNNGVSTDVIQAMQTPAPAPMAPGPVVAGGPPVIVEEHYYPSPMWGPHCGYYHHPRPRGGSRVSWGVSVMR